MLTFSLDSVYSVRKNLFAPKKSHVSWFYLEQVLENANCNIFYYIHFYLNLHFSLLISNCEQEQIYCLVFGIHVLDPHSVERPQNHYCTFLDYRIISYSFFFFFQIYFSYFIQHNSRLKDNYYISLLIRKKNCITSYSTFYCHLNCNTLYLIPIYIF